jgi:thioredoxin reductase (NADPH)
LVSPYEKPTRLEALRYYRRVVDGFGLEVTLGERVESVLSLTEGGERLFEVRSIRERGSGGPRVRRARSVVLAVGYYEQPNRLHVPGEDLPHVSHFYREAHAHYGQRVVVVGGANSAAEAALELYRAGARVTLVHRGAAPSESIKYWVLPDLQNRIKEGAIAARFGSQVLAITPDLVRIARGDAEEAIPADAVLLLTGYHTDREFLKRCGLTLEAASCVPVHDPETLETNVPNLFLAGGVIAGEGRAPVFIENGRLHGEKVIATIAARLKSSGL